MTIFISCVLCFSWPYLSLSCTNNERILGNSRSKTQASRYSFSHQNFTENTPSILRFHSHPDILSTSQVIIIYVPNQVACDSLKDNPRGSLLLRSTGTTMVENASVIPKSRRIKFFAVTDRTCI